MVETITIATRQSRLALWQAEFIRDRLVDAWPEIRVELCGMTTAGDRWLNSPLSQVGGKGLFIKELEEAMLDGRADIAVHSMKDVPARLPEGFAVPVIGFRADVRDALVAPGAESLGALPVGARVGSSSLRRQAMILAKRGDLEMLPVRCRRLRRPDSGVGRAGSARARCTDSGAPPRRRFPAGGGTGGVGGGMPGGRRGSDRAPRRAERPAGR
jgi:hydroxymethylbilane synthase